MMYRSGVGLAALALSVPMSAKAATLTVCGSGQGCNYTTIDAAVDAAVSGVDVIQLNATTWTEDIDSIDKAVTIQGQSATNTLTGTNNKDVLRVNNNQTGVTIKNITLDPVGNSRAIFLGTSASVTVENVTVTSQDSTASGIGLYASTGSTVTIRGSTFDDLDVTHVDYTDQNGGAIVLTGATATITSSAFSNCAGEDRGGAIYAYNSTLTINDSLGATRFSANSSSNGGAIYAYSSTVSIDGANFSSNTTSGSGGAVYFDQGDASTVTDSEFASNSATNFAGALIANSGAGPTFRRNRLCDNYGYYGGSTELYGTFSSTANISNSFIYSNDAGWTGGGIDITGSSGRIRYNSLIANTSSGNHGGAIWTDSDVEVSNDVLQSNSNEASALRIYQGSVTAAMIVKYDMFYGNAGSNVAYGGGTWNLDGTNRTTSDMRYLPRTTGASSIGSDCDIDFFVRYDSAARNGGDPTVDDLDLTDSDVGMFGGPDADPAWWVDSDGDGYPWVYDCNDASASIHPNLASDTACNAIDDDCDGTADEDNSTARVYRDVDGDGYGDPSASTAGCGTSGYVANSSDCNDGNAAVNPGASEACDASNVDEDCDGLADDADSTATGKTNFYIDSDHDNYGTSSAQLRCDVATGFATVQGDCNDSAASINPGAAEVCDASNVDENCNGSADDNDGSATGKTTFYTDNDLDNYGTGAGTQRCDGGAGYSSVSTDCDDTNSTIRPGGQEVCDAGNKDEDCDGLVEDADPTTSSATKVTFYVDGDGDTYGGSTTAQRCDVATGFAATSTDCNDGSAAINPGASEVCDASNVDEDCDTQADDNDASATGKTTMYRDQDGDTWGTSSTTSSRCDAGGGYIVRSGDCNDTQGSINPGATEVCDAANTDEDCDAVADDLDASTSAATKSAFYLDADADAYGGATTVTACDSPGSTWGTASGDCDDANAGVHPGALEQCDAVDRNCDGQPGNIDQDADGTPGCAGDCNDGNALIEPGLAETCNGVDNNCSGNELDASDVTTFYDDDDNDGAGDPNDTTGSCTLPTGYVANALDCDDSASAIGPTIPEVCDSVDQDCDGVVDDGVTTTYYRDADADGYGNQRNVTDGCSAPSGYVAAGTDCNDGAASVYPGATEVCDSVDQDCDTLIDDGVTTRYYADADADAHGDSSVFSDACGQPSGFVSSSDDCDDAANGVHPGATEVCDGVDQDCDGAVDDYATDRTLFYVDSDGDQHGSITGSVLTCDAPSGYVASSDDCNDAVGTVYPGAVEQCNSIDDDCDGAVDDGVVDTTWYRDVDGDGSGVASNSTVACAAPSGFVAASGDCDDSSAAVHPGAAEDCGGLDLDCDGDVNGPNPVDAISYYSDADADGYGTGAALGASCTPPAGTAGAAGDCNDADDAIHPTAPEHCDGIDEDCDGDANDSVSTFVYYRDDDGDGFGSGSTTTGCITPTGYADVGGDCTDTDPTAFPGAAESCDGVDDDCNGVVDNNPTDATTWYGDADGDGLGDPLRRTEACNQPSGFVANGNDCDDSDPLVTDGSTWYADTDLDGYGDDDDSQYSCNQPSGYISRGGDCDDAHADTNPGAGEYCEGTDQDCDGQIDEDAVDAATWYLDGDNDGYGLDLSASIACVRPSGYSALPGDCDDTANTVSPGSPEQCDNLIDDNCNGQTDEQSVDVDWYLDTDGDGYGDSSGTPILDCKAPGPDYVANGLDCVDEDDTVNPNALEVCNGIDDDCDGQLDDEAADAGSWYIDGDGDGWGDTNGFVYSCEPPANSVGPEFRGDCDDGDITIYPGAPEICDALDNDCDATHDVDEGAGDTWYADEDGDGYGAADESVQSCDDPGDGSVSNADDCDDGDGDAYPGAAEVPYDAVDQDCDGADLCDVDGDDYDAEVCGGDDCDDEEPTTYPGADDPPGDGDSNCDGEDPSNSGTDRDRPLDEDTGALSAKGCSCDAGSGPNLAWLGALGVLTLLSRRTRR